MEGAPLNKAHQEYRFAEKHLRYKRFDEAIHCHLNAAAHILEAMKLTSSPKALESLKCQYEYHVKQHEALRAKKIEFENYKKLIENKRNGIDSQKQSETIQMVFKTMNEADSLLDMLTLKEESVDVEKEHDEIDSVTTKEIPVLGSKKPKDDRVVIEELRTVNQQLHELILQLVTQLEISNKEIDVLRGKIKLYDEERAKNQDKSNDGGDTNKQNSLQVTDSSGGTSPFVFSPCSDFGPEIIVPIQETSLDLSDNTINKPT